MKITYEDGTSETCEITEQRQILHGGFIRSPKRIPKGAEKLWNNPPTYGRLVVIGCKLIVPGHFVRTAAGVKEVVSVERD
jgi:hypothetical protein